jgi:hypothetical protein
MEEWVDERVLPWSRTTLMLVKAAELHLSISMCTESGTKLHTANQEKW